MKYNNIDSLIEKIKAYAPISSVAESMGIELQQVGNGRFKSFSIYNQEKTPSQMYRNDVNKYKDFSSGTSGDTLDLVGDFYKLDLIEAIEKLAEITNFNLSPYKRELTVEEKIKEELYKTTAEAQRILTDNVWKSEKALKYLHSRGVSDKTIRELGIGYAPPAEFGKTCLSFLANAESLQFCRTDVFSDAITFPLEYEGRIWSFQTKPFNNPFNAKYTSVSDSHPLFSPFRTMFLQNARKLAKEEGINEISLTEGAFDAILALQNDIPCVACLGTNNLKKELYEALKGYRFSNIYLVLDGDNAGRTATLKHAKEFASKNYGLDMSIVQLPLNKDLADTINDNGIEFLNDLYSKAIYCEEFILESIEYTSEYEYLTKGIEVLKSFNSDVGKLYGIRYFSRKTGFDEVTIKDMLLSKQAQTEPLVDIDSEEICLGNLINDENFIFESQLTETDFYLFRHKHIFESIKAVGNNIDSILSYCKDKKFDVSRDFLQYLTERVYDEYALKNVIDKSSRRKALAVLNSSVEDIQNLEKPIDTTIETATDKLFKSTHSKEDEVIVSIKTGCEQLLEKVEKARKSGNSITGYSFGDGFKLLDAYTLGLNKSEYFMISANSSEGKSMLCANFISSWIEKGLHVLLFSHEMSVVDNTMRIVSIVSGIEANKILTGRMNEEEYRLFISTMNKVKTSNLEIVAEENDANSCLSMARNRVQRGKCDIVIIDYIQLQTLSGLVKENRTQELTNISRAWRSFALKFNIPVVFVSQLGKQGENKQEHNMSDVMSAYALAQDCTTMITIRKRTEKEMMNGVENTGNKVVQICKNRNGAKDVFISVFHEEENFRLREV